MLSGGSALLRGSFEPISFDARRNMLNQSPNNAVAPDVLMHCGLGDYPMSDVGEWHRPCLKDVKDNVLRRFCPVCGSTDVSWIGGLPILAPHMECKDCGHRGVFILGDEGMIQIARKRYFSGGTGTQEEDEEDSGRDE